VATHSIAWEMPTTRGRNQVEAASGTRPRRAKMKLRRAVSAAMRMSIGSVIVTPALTAGPLITPITGLRQAAMDVFGNNIEDRMRKIPFLIFYLASGYVAAYGFAAANPPSAAALIGASGAIAGVLGAYLVLYPRAKVWSLVPFLFFILVRIPAWAVLGLWFVLQWACSAGISTEGAGSVAYLAHVFGFLAGALVGLVMRAAGSRAASNA
jgi:hypothetical protein